MTARVAAFLAFGAILGACVASDPGPSEADACSSTLPARTSPVDHPVAVLHVRGDDLPPVVGAIEWSGGSEPVATTAALPVHRERFTVLQVTGVSDVSVRMTDGVGLAAWKVEAQLADEFRTEGPAPGVTWVEGEGTTDVLCVPVTDGEWVVRADLTFADEQGEGTFYWRLNISGADGS
ncbi:MAG: hypothetical protein ABIW50_01455 [Candidatus Limnocylindria bacterium]